MKWPALLLLLFEERQGPPPYVLVVHLGGNDLGLLMGKDLSLRAKADLAVMKGWWLDAPPPHGQCFLQCEL